jgi:hypothetical protein
MSTAADADLRDSGSFAAAAVWFFSMRHEAFYTAVSLRLENGDHREETIPGK